MCAERGFEVRVTSPDLRRLSQPPGLRVVDRLRAVCEIEDFDYDLVFVHRDAEGQDPALRFGEIASAMTNETNRRLLMERLDIHGPVKQLSAWKALEEKLDEALAQLPTS